MGGGAWVGLRVGRWGHALRCKGKEGTTEKTARKGPSFFCPLGFLLGESFGKAYQKSESCRPLLGPCADQCSVNPGTRRDCSWWVGSGYIVSN